MCLALMVFGSPDIGLAQTIQESKPVDRTATSTSITAAVENDVTGLITASQPIGTLSGKAGVSLDGAATYSIPIDVPKGRAGIEPSLSINYSSNAGAGPLGIGFSLGGISVIQRCPLDSLHPEVVHAGAVDLCFGGRLLLTEGEHNVPGAIYRVHGNPGVRITFEKSEQAPTGTSLAENPKYLFFTVSYPDGRTGKFGTEGAYASAPKAKGGSQVVAWYIRWLQDEHGNRMRYTYVDGGGTMLLPGEILYTLNFSTSDQYPALDFGSRRVVFNYQDREPEDIYTAYRAMGMGPVEMTKTLLSIKTFASSDLVHTYTFSYKNWTHSKRTVLHTMSKCDAEGVCLPYSEFEWELGEGGYDSITLPAIAAGTVPNLKDIAASVTMDVDHDGKMELLFAYDSRADATAARWNVWDPDTGINPTPVPAWFIESSAGLVPSVADINLDGVADLVTPYCDDGPSCDDVTLAPMRYAYANKIRVVLGDPGNVDGIAVWAYPDMIETDDKVFMAHVAEIDGDGYPDMFACRGESAEIGRWNLMLNRPADNNGVGRKFVSHRTRRPCFVSDLYQVMDADGDGRSELWVAEKSTSRFNQGTFAGVDPEYGNELGIGGIGFYTYIGLELPHTGGDGQVLSIADAIALTQTANGEIGWPKEGIVSHTLPIDFSQRILQGCWRPDSEEVLPDELHAQIAAVAGDNVADSILGLYHHPSNPAGPDGTIPEWLESEIFDQFVTPPSDTRIPRNVPFVSSGPSPDRHVDLNGDGLLDLVRSVAINADGETTDVYKQANASSPATCRADEYFDFGFELYINNGREFESAGIVKLLESVRPWRAAKFLSRVTPIDYNSDGRTDWLSPDFGKYFGEAAEDEIALEGAAPSGGVVDQWEILVAQPTSDPDQPIKYAELDLSLKQLWYDGSFEWSQMLEQHLAALFKEIGRPFTGEIDSDEFPDIVSRAVTAIHLSDRHLQDIMFFPGTDANESILAGAKAGNRPDYLLRVTNGLGAVTEWDYRPGHDKDIYWMSEGNDTATPFTPSMLVSEHRRDTGLGENSWMRRSYRYVGAYADRRGLGGLGIQQRTVATRAQDEDEAQNFSRTERAHIIDFDPGHLAYPLAGRTTRSVSDTAFTSGGPRRYITQHLNRWETLVAPHSNYTVGIRSRTSSTFDLHDGIHQCVGTPCSESALEDETALRTRRTDVLVFDELGVVIENLVEHGDGMTTHTVRDVVNHASNADNPYATGLETSKTVTDKTPNGTAKREVSAAYKSQTLDLQSETREPNDNNGLLFRRTKYSRDIRGNIIKTTVKTRDSTRSTSTSYDVNGYHATIVTNAAGHKIRRDWHEGLGAVVRTIDANGQVAETCVDGFARLTCTRGRSSLSGPTTGEEFTFQLETVPAGFDGEAVYRLSTYRNGSWQLRLDSDRLGREKRRMYRVSKGNIYLGAEYQVLTTYDERFKVETVSNPIATAFPPAVVPITVFSYDRVGREVLTKRPDGSNTKKFYQGLRTVHTDASSVETKLDRDVLGRLVKRTTHTLGTCFTYGAFGTIVATNRNCDEAEGEPIRTTLQSFDAWNRRLLIQDPELGKRIENWDGFDQRVAMIDGNNKETKYKYDNIGRLQKRITIDGTATWTYDIHSNGVGKLSKSRSEDGTVIQQQYYDEFGRPAKSMTKVRNDTFKMKHEYFQNRLLKIDYPTLRTLGGGLPYRVRYEYDLTGYVHRVLDDITGALLWELQGMDGWRHVTKERASVNDFETQRHYDENTGRQTQDYVANSDGNAVVARSYSWSTDGNLEHISDLVAGQTRSYKYDAFDQLRTTFDGAEEVASVNYDVYGNIAEKSGVGLYEYDKTTGRLHSAASTSYKYDSNGSVVEHTNENGSALFDWTALGKLHKVESASGSASFTYDANGVEVRKKIADGVTTTSVGGLFQQRKGGGGPVENRYIIMAGGRAIAQVTRTVSTGFPTTLRYLHTDYRGSLIATSDSAGSMTLGDYDPWGQKLGGSPIPFTDEPVTTGFTSHDSELVGGLIDMRARYYDPRLGRFISADTVVPNPANGLDWNRYSYVRNNPLKYIDPSGHGPAAPSEESPDDEPSDDVGDTPEGGTYDPGSRTCSDDDWHGVCGGDPFPGNPLPNLPSGGVTGSGGLGTDDRTSPGVSADKGAFDPTGRVRKPTKFDKRPGEPLTESDFYPESQDPDSLMRKRIKKRIEGREASERAAARYRATKESMGRVWHEWGDFFWGPLDSPQQMWQRLDMDGNGSLDETAAIATAGFGGWIVGATIEGIAVGVVFLNLGKGADSKVDKFKSKNQDEKAPQPVHQGGIGGRP